MASMESRILALWRNSKTVAEIAARLNVSAERVVKVIADFEVSRFS